MNYQSVKKDTGDDNNVRPEYTTGLKSQQLFGIDSSSSTTRQPDSSRQNIQKESPFPPNSETAAFVNNESSEWKSFFNSLAPESLQQLYEMVERNEVKEINSIRNEFEPKLAPILEGIAYKRQQYRS